MAFIFFFLSLLSMQGFSQVDNNSSSDMYDPVLESPYYGADGSTEEAQFGIVAAIIQEFVSKQYNLRKEAESSKKPKEVHTRVLQDLPGNAAYATRDVHRKTHGCYQATLRMDENIQASINTVTEEYNKTYDAAMGPRPQPVTDLKDLGVFQPGAKYNAIVRYSNGHPGNRFDGDPDARGMAVKILPNDVNVDVLSASQISQLTLLDILTINFPTFFVNDPVTYAKINEKFLQSAEDFRSILSAKPIEASSIFFTGMSALEKQLALYVNGSIIKSPLFQEYFSMVPSRLGPSGTARAIKYIWSPVACDLDLTDTFLQDKKEYWPDWANERIFSDPLRFVDLPFVLNPSDTPPFEDGWEHYYLREQIYKKLSKSSHCFELQAQLYRDLKSTNIEDSLDVWLSSEEERGWWNQNVVEKVDEDKYTKQIQAKKLAPRFRLGTLEVLKVESASETQNTKVCEDLSFNPWNGDILHHKPLGVVSRMKRRVYNASRRQRHIINNVSIPERPQQH